VARRHVAQGGAAEGGLTVDQPPITGLTRVYGILADPIAQVRTPQALNALMRARGIDGVLVPLHVPADGLRALLAGIRAWQNFGGFIATVPHKPAMIELCDEATPRAKAIGAANAVRRNADGTLSADMLDGDGFIAGLAASGIQTRDAAVFLAGAGGAANAIAFALAAAGIAALTIHNRTARRAQELVDRLAVAYPAFTATVGDDPHGHDLVVNATSLGMKSGDNLPLDTSRLEERMTVAEIIMQPEMTPLLAAARARGCRIQPGLPMLTGQVEAMVRFLGIAP
jgi:shikimate dehydrogenase